MSDLVRRLGPLAFASRLKRLSDRLYRDMSRVYAELDTDFESRWFLVLYLLAEQSPLGVTNVADRLGLTHPAVNQIVGAMSRHRLVHSRRDPTDERRRLLSLTPGGRRLFERLRPVWQIVSEKSRDAMTESGLDWIAALDRLEAVLDERSMYERVSTALRRDAKAKPARRRSSR